MASPTITLIGHTEIDDADANTNWSGTTIADADIKKEGTNAMSGVLKADLDVAYYDDSTTRSIAGEHLRVWVNTINTPYMENEAGGGYELYVYDGTNTDYYTIFGSDTYAGGWFNAVVDCSLFTTVTDANVDRWGLRVNHTSNSKNATNVWIDYFRYLDGYYFTGGTSGDKVTLADIATADKGTTTLYGYGIVEDFEEVYFCSGELQIGNGATTTYFEMDGDVLVYTDKPVADGLYELNGNGSGANITITNSTIKAAGTGDANRPDIDMSTGSPGTVSITNNVFIKCGTFDFASGQTNTGNSFNDCQQVTTNGSNISGGSAIDSAVAADTGAVYQNVAYTDTYLDDMTFEMGTNSHHAIDFGTAVTSNLTLRNCEFTGFGSTDDANDSTVRFLATSGSITLSLIDCTVGGAAATDSNFSVDDAAGIAVTLSINPVTALVHVNDNNGDDLSGAQVWLRASDGTGDLPYQQSISSITRATTTATVNFAAAHGLKTNDYLKLSGITDKTEDNFGAHQVTYVDTDTVTYTTTDSGSTNYTGTITGTGGMIYGTTDVNGDISVSRVLTNDQPFDLRVAKASASPRFKVVDTTGTVDNADGITVNIKMVLDE